MRNPSYSPDISVAGGNGHLLMRLWLVCIANPIQKRLPGRWQQPCCQWLGHTLVCQLKANSSILTESIHAYPPLFVFVSGEVPEKRTRKGNIPRWKEHTAMHLEISIYHCFNNYCSRKMWGCQMPGDPTAVQ